MFLKNFKSRYFFSKIHFMDSQINKVHSPTIFCVVLSDLMVFWDASILSQIPRVVTYNINRQGVQLPRPLTAECLQNLAEFLPLPKIASQHLQGSTTSKSCSIFKLRSGFCYCHMIRTELIHHWNQIKLTNQKAQIFPKREQNYKSTLFDWLI